MLEGRTYGNDLNQAWISPHFVKASVSDLVTMSHKLPCLPCMYGVQRVSFSEPWRFMSHISSFVQRFSYCVPKTLLLNKTVSVTRHFVLSRGCKELSKHFHMLSLKLEFIDS